MFVVFQLIELYARGSRHLDGTSGVGEQACLLVTTEDLHLVRITAGTKEEFSIGRDAEVARMDACGLESYLGQRAVFLVHLPDCDTISMEAMRGIDELAIGRDMNIGTTSCIERVGLQGLDDTQMLVFILQHEELAGEFAQEVGVLAVGRPSQMTWTSSRIDLHVIGFCNGFNRKFSIAEDGKRIGGSSFAHLEYMDLVHAEVIGHQILAIGGEVDSMDVGMVLALRVDAVAGELQDKVFTQRAIVAYWKFGDTPTAVTGGEKGVLVRAEDDVAGSTCMIALAAEADDFGFLFIENEGIGRAAFRVIFFANGIEVATIARYPDERWVGKPRVTGQIGVVASLLIETVDSDTLLARVAVTTQPKQDGIFFCLIASCEAQEHKAECPKINAIHI